MEGRRRQPGTLEGLSRFLVQHERCGAGFDVAHPAGLGSGRVSITCRGCGARHEYATATIEFEREVRIEPSERSRAEAAPDSPPIPPRPAPYPDSPPAVPTESESAPADAPLQRLPAPSASEAATAAPATGPRSAAAAGQGASPQGFLSSPRTTIALLAIASVALLIAVVALLDNGSEGGPQALTQSTPTATAPQQAPGPAANPTPAPAPPPTVTLRTSLFKLELPPDWSRRKVGGSLLLEPPTDRRVNVQVYFQSSADLTEGAMAAETARFLRREVPGARIYPQRERIGGIAVRELTARGPGETAIAVDVLRGPYRYLLVRRIFAGAKPHVSLAAGRIVRSFELN